MSGILLWVQQYGPYVQFFGQLLFWLVIAAVAVYAAWLFKRLVDAQVASLRAGLPATPVEAERAVSVEEFVD